MIMEFPRDAWKVPAMICHKTSWGSVPAQWRDQWTKESRHRQEDECSRLKRAVIRIIGMRDAGVPGINCSLNIEDFMNMCCRWSDDGKFTNRCRQLVLEHHGLLES